MTGGSSGIGFEICRQLGEPSCDAYFAAAPPHLGCDAAHWFTLERSRGLCHICEHAHAVSAGKHGAAIVIVGRRGAVVDKAVEQLRTEQIEAEGCSGDVRSPARAPEAQAD